MNRLKILMVLLCWRGKKVSPKECSYFFVNYGEVWCKFYTLESHSISVNVESFVTLSIYYRLISTRCWGSIQRQDQDISKRIETRRSTRRFETENTSCHLCRTRPVGGVGTLLKVVDAHRPGRQSCQLSLASQWRWLGRWPACDRSQLCQARRHCSLWTLSMASFCCFPLFLEFCSMLYTVSLVTLPFTVPLPKQVMCNSATARCYLQDTFFILYLKDTFRKYLEILKTLFWRYVSKILFNWTLVCRQQIRACFRQLTNQSTDVFVYKFAAVSICRALSKNWIL